MAIDWEKELEKPLMRYTMRVFLPCFIVALVFLTIKFSEALPDGMRTFGWLKTTGVIEESSYRSTPGPSFNSRFTPTIAYSYEVDGITHQSEVVTKTFGYGTFKYEHQARRVVNRYPEGSVVDVYYDPSDPEEAVLERGVKWFAVMPLVVGPIFALAFLRLLFEVWRKRPMKRAVQ
ncbi:MAG: DUF3592 domain-containing protein [Planctomycetota bacterium]